MSAQPQLDTSNPQHCLELISALPLTNLPQAREQLEALIFGMQGRPPSPAAQLEVLEMARAPVAFLQEETAQRYASKPLPPASSEDQTLSRVVRLWQAMARAYAAVAERGGSDPEIQTRIALICQRCIHYAGMVILEYFRARRELPKGLWIDLHGYYASAEEWGIATTRVSEPLAEGVGSQNCAEAYSAVLLLDLANSYGRNPREFGWISRWVHRFAPYTAIVEPGGVPDGRTYCLSLMQDRGLRPFALCQPGPFLRRFDGSRLTPEIHAILAQLKQRASPAELGLGDDCVMPAAARLLVRLYRPWCLAATARRHPRRGSAGSAELCFGMEAIHYFVRGAEFQQPEPARIYSRSDVYHIVTFGERVNEGEPLHVHTAQAQGRYAQEYWAVADESVGGFRLMRGRVGNRVDHGQLIGIRPPDGERMLLGQVIWMMYENGGNLLIGVAVLPGTPEAVAARPTAAKSATPGRYERAFLLPALPALKEEASLVVPRGWYRPEHVLQLYTDREFEVRLTRLLGQGPDFERVGFAPL